MSLALGTEIIGEKPVGEQDVQSHRGKAVWDRETVQWRKGWGKGTVQVGDNRLNSGPQMTLLPGRIVVQEAAQNWAGLVQILALPTLT